jgi:pantetheine-phosphate adenylyltransferase
MPRRVAIYPGSFDPLTNGHLAIIQRGLKLFESLIVAVANNPEKRPVFSYQERMELIREAMSDDPRLEIDSFDGLLVDYAKKRSVHTVLRGLRAVSDFEYEFQLAGMNRDLYPDMETVFLTPSEQNMFISATLVREIATLGGDVSKFVHPSVVKRFKQKAKR